MESGVSIIKTIQSDLMVVLLTKNIKNGFNFRINKFLVRSDEQEILAKTKAKNRNTIQEVVFHNANASSRFITLKIHLSVYLIFAAMSESITLLPALIRI